MDKFFTGEKAQIVPLISESGKLEEVFVVNQGSGYSKPLHLRETISNISEDQSLSEILNSFSEGQEFLENIQNNRDYFLGAQLHASGLGESVDGDFTILEISDTDHLFNYLSFRTSFPRTRRRPVYSFMLSLILLLLRSLVIPVGVRLQKPLSPSLSSCCFRSIG